MLEGRGVRARIEEATEVLRKRRNKEGTQPCHHFPGSVLLLLIDSGERPQHRLLLAALESVLVAEVTAD